MIQIGLQYSNDGGSTWSTALEIDAYQVRVSEVNEADNATTAVTGKRYPRKFTYLFVLIEPNKDWFDPSHPTYGTNADARWAELENICSGNLIRLYNRNTTCWPNIDGHTEFNASNNTAYLLLESNSPRFDNMDEPGATGRKRRTMTIELQTQSAV
jgi:hypothetical protein